MHTRRVSPHEDEGASEAQLWPADAPVRFRCRAAQERAPPRARRRVGLDLLNEVSALRFVAAGAYPRCKRRPEHSGHDHCGVRIPRRRGIELLPQQSIKHRTVEPSEGVAPTPRKERRSSSSLSLSSLSSLSMSSSLSSSLSLSSSTLLQRSAARAAARRGRRCRRRCRRCRSSSSSLTVLGSVAVAQASMGPEHIGADARRPCAQRTRIRNVIVCLRERSDDLGRWVGVAEPRPHCSGLRDGCAGNREAGEARPSTGQKSRARENDGVRGPSLPYDMGWRTLGCQLCLEMSVSSEGQASLATMIAIFRDDELHHCHCARQSALRFAPTEIRAPHIGRGLEIVPMTITDRRSLDVVMTTVATLMAQAQGVTHEGCPAPSLVVVQQFRSPNFARMDQARWALRSIVPCNLASGGAPGRDRRPRRTGTPHATQTCRR